MNKSTIATLIFGGIVALAAVASSPFVVDRINGWLGKTPEISAPPANIAGTGESAQEAVPVPGTAIEAPGEMQPSAEGSEQMAAVPENRAAEASQVPAVTVPSFGLLRVEPDGSTVIAGQAGANADIEVLSGSNKIASARAAANGDFVAILDVPLPPGDYEIVLRATEQDGDVAMSEETAIVSVPDKGQEGELLALVEQPGAASRLINVPKPRGLQPQETHPQETPQPQTQPETPVASAPGEAADEPAAAVDMTEPVPEAPAEESQIAAVAPAESEQPAAQQLAVKEPDVQQPAADGAASSPAEPPAEVASTPTETKVPRITHQPGGGEVRIEAVEIDNGSVFVAGSAPAGAQVRVYANDVLLGDTRASPGGRFLIEVQRDLPVGDYIVRADVIDPASADVVARAAVPFSRGAGDKIAAVAVDNAQPATGGEKAPAAVPAGEETLEVPAPEEGLPATTPPELSGDVAVTAPQLQQTDSSVIIRRGDTLWHISRRVYGRGTRFTTIYLANQDQIKDPDMIWPGQIFALPQQAAPDGAASN
jgi:nucleoid-associated protein YgaU